MRIEEALTMVLCGVGVAAHVLRRKKMAVGCGLLILVMGGVTLVEILFPVDLGVDRWLFNFSLPMQSMGPSRVAPIGALGFVLIGLTLVVDSLSKSGRGSLVATMYLAGLILEIGAVSLIGCWINPKATSEWCQSTCTATQTDAGFMILGGSILVGARQRWRSQDQSRPMWTAGFAGMAVLGTTFLVWQALSRDEQRAILNTTAEVARQVRNEIDARLDARNEALRRMADRWVRRGGTPRAEWEADAQKYLADFPAYQAIEWVDASYRVRWIVPLEGNAAAKDLNLAFEPRRRAALEAAKEKRSVTVTAPIDLVQGGKGFLVYVPIWDSDQFEGFILGVYRIRELLASFLESENIAQGYGLRVSFQDEVFYDRGWAVGMPTASHNRWKASSTVEIGSLLWQVEATPLPGKLESLRSPIQAALLVPGVCIAVLLTWSFHLYQATRRRAADLAIVNDQLEAEATERERAHERFSRLVDAAPNGFIMVDRQGAIILVNIQAEHMFGYPRHEMLGRPIELLLPERHAAAHPGMRDSYFREPSSRQMGVGRDLTARRKDGSEFPVEVGLSPIQMAEGLVVLASVVDITDRKQAQEALRKSEERLELAVTGSQDGLWDWDLLTDVVWYAPRFKSLLGYRDNEFPDIFSSFEEALYPEDQDATLNAISAHLKEDQPYDVEYRLRGKDGRYRWYRARGVAIRDEAGRPLRMSGSIQDIQDRKEAQQLILAKNLDLETLLYVTSHDLREPLRAIQNFSRMVYERYADQIDEKGRDFLKRAVRGADRMDRLFEDILLLSRAQRAEVVREEVDPKEVVRDVLGRLSNRIEQSRAEITVADDLPPLHGDRRWIAQAVYNLVANALKFTVDGQPPQIEIGPYRDPGGIDGRVASHGLVVRDRGPGVQARHAERIFTLFQRAVGREVEGTGAGLAIVRQVVQRYGGSAWCRPREGGGSEFFLSFPALEASGVET